MITLYIQLQIFGSESNQNVLYIILERSTHITTHLQCLVSSEQGIETKATSQPIQLHCHDVVLTFTISPS
ncbi:hypothetical protein AQUCO_00201376v1 [Aquilegia coerulea]|uniref:Uncharacterized protein n=1 Tax=Aquilegia coerulea TaxID=218851 RepID=A0A2G5F805_AQUCA|nr:hypothetical protein AQUCO_00201376v1 [Aquilegia coerulea]